MKYHIEYTGHLKETRISWFPDIPLTDFVHVDVSDETELNQNILRHMNTFLLIQGMIIKSNPVERFFVPMSMLSHISTRVLPLVTADNLRIKDGEMINDKGKVPLS